MHFCAAATTQKYEGTVAPQIAGCPTLLCCVTLSMRTRLPSSCTDAWHWEASGVGSTCFLRLSWTLRKKARSVRQGIFTFCVAAAWCRNCSLFFRLSVHGHLWRQLRVSTNSPLAVNQFLWRACVIEMSYAVVESSSKF